MKNTMEKQEMIDLFKKSINKDIDAGNKLINCLFNNKQDLNEFISYFVNYEENKRSKTQKRKVSRNRFIKNTKETFQETIKKISSKEDVARIFWIHSVYHPNVIKQRKEDQLKKQINQLLNGEIKEIQLYIYDYLDLDEFKMIFKIEEDINKETKTLSLYSKEELKDIIRKLFYSSEWNSWDCEGIQELENLETLRNERECSHGIWYQCSYDIPYYNLSFEYSQTKCGFGLEFCE